MALKSLAELNKSFMAGQHNKVPDDKPIAPAREDKPITQVKDEQPITPVKNEAKANKAEKHKAKRQKAKKNKQELERKLINPSANGKGKRKNVPEHEPIIPLMNELEVLGKTKLPVTAETEAIAEKVESPVTDAEEAIAEKTELLDTDEAEAIAEDTELPETDEAEAIAEDTELPETDATEALTEKTELPAADNTEAIAAIAPKPGKIRRIGSHFALLSDILFYLAVVLVLVTVLTPDQHNGAPKTIFGYSYFSVVSRSMQDEIPKGSFILVKNVDPQNLTVGDTITYMRDRNTSVTHKIVDIRENYNKSGALGFQTKGVNNANPDSDIVYEANVVGKVIFVLPGLGTAMTYLGTNIYIVCIIFGLCVVISFCLRGFFQKPRGRRLVDG